MILREVYQRIRAVEVMHRAAAASARHFCLVCQANPAFLHGKDLRVRDIRDCVADLEDTYLIRMYAIIEIVLRDFWANVCLRKTRPQAKDLIDRIAARSSILAEDIGRVHRVREYRNWLLHGGRESPRISLADSLKYLSRFLSRLPPRW